MKKIVISSVAIVLMAACQATAQKPAEKELSLSKKLALVEKEAKPAYDAFTARYAEFAQLAQSGELEKMSQTADSVKVIAMQQELEGLYEKYEEVNDSLYRKYVFGTKFAELTMNDLDGKPVNLSQWVGKGNYVMVDFWASWCGPCRGEMPNVVANYQKYHAKGFEVVGVSFDQKGDAWKKAVADLGMTWPQMSDLKGWQCAASSVYNIHSIPASVLFDPEGKICDMNLRGEELGEKLKEIYGE